MLQLVRKSLSLSCNKVAKLCLITMTAHPEKQEWSARELSKIIGTDIKTLRNSLRELMCLRVIKIIGTNESNAFLYAVDVEHFNFLGQLEFDWKIQADLKSLSRRVERYHSRDSNRPEPSKAKL